MTSNLTEGEIYTRSIFIPFYRKGDFNCPAYELLDILEQFEDTQVDFSTLTVSDCRLATFLESEGIAKKTTRGSYVRAEKYEEFFASFQEMLYNSLNCEGV